jgi:hypothetical protein
MEATVVHSPSQAAFDTTTVRHAAFPTATIQTTQDLPSRVFQLKSTQKDD